jgi:ubiquinone/menaquinone biosynthesis C-methylase UbiE
MFGDLQPSPDSAYFRVTRLVQMETKELRSQSTVGKVLAGDGYLAEMADKYARAYSEETPGGFALRVRRQRVLELFDKREGKVLDVGCGPGEMVQPLLGLGCEFWGVDPSMRMIEMCRSRFRETREAHFTLGQASQLSFPDNFFDAVLCMGVIDSMKNVRPAIGEMLRVLKPGGTLIATFPNRDSPYVLWKGYVFYPVISLIRRLTSRQVSNDPVFIKRSLFTPQSASELVCAAGGRALRIVGHFYNVLLSPLDEIWPGGTLWLNRRLEQIRDGKMDRLAAGFILKARKI